MGKAVPFRRKRDDVRIGIHDRIKTGFSGAAGILHGELEGRFPAGDEATISGDHADGVAVGKDLFIPFCDHGRGRCGAGHLETRFDKRAPSGFQRDQIEKDGIGSGAFGGESKEIGPGRTRWAGMHMLIILERFIDDHRMQALSMTDGEIFIADRAAAGSLQGQLENGRFTHREIGQRLNRSDDRKTQLVEVEEPGFLEAASFEHTFLRHETSVMQKFARFDGHCAKPEIGANATNRQHGRGDPLAAGKGHPSEDSHVATFFKTRTEALAGGAGSGGNSLANMVGHSIDGNRTGADLCGLVVVGGGLAGCGAARAAARVLGPGAVVLVERGERLLSGWRAREVTGKGAAPSEGAVGTLSPDGLPTGWGEAIEGFPSAALPDGTVETLSHAILHELTTLGVNCRFDAKAIEVSRDSDRNFRVWFESGTPVAGRRLVVATGGGRQVGRRWAEEWHQPWRAMVPAGLNFRTTLSRSRGWGTLAPVSAEIAVAASGSSMPLTARGWLDGIYPWLGGSALVALSLDSPDALEKSGYRGEFTVNWLPNLDGGVSMRAFQQFQQEKGRRLVHELPWGDLSPALWRFVLGPLKIPAETPWQALSTREAQILAHRVTHTKIPFKGFRLDRNGGVHAGGVALDGLVPGTFESLPLPGLFWVGEVVDLHALDLSGNLHLAIAAGAIAGETAAQQLLDP